MKKIILVLLVLILTGCSNYKELDDISIVSAIAVDCENNQYEMSVQIVNTQKPDQKQDQTSSDFFVYSSTGDNVQEAIRNTMKISPRKIYISHNQVLIISDKCAEKGIKSIIDYFARDTESRNDYQVLISKDIKAKDIIDNETAIENINAFDIKKSIEVNALYLGRVKKYSLDNLIYDFTHPFIDISVPIITIEENNDEENEKLKKLLLIDNMAAFNGEKLKGFLSEDESLTVNIFTNKIDNFILKYECEKDKYIVLELQNTNSSLIYNNEILTLKVKADANLNEITCNEKVEKVKVLSKINKEANEHLKNIIKNSYNNIKKEYGTKILKIDKYLHEINKKNYKTLKIKTDIKIESIGNVLGEIENENN